MRKRYQIFISSTYTDLVDERKAVFKAVLNMHQIPSGMEQFSANSAEQWDVIQEELDSSNYYILILGRRYGSLIESGDDMGISFTEKEFNYACAHDIPILAFIKADDANYNCFGFENDVTKLAKLNQFTEKVKKGRIVKWFRNETELAAQVTVAIHNMIEKNNRPGWIRGTISGVETKIDELIRLLNWNTIILRMRKNFRRMKKILFRHMNFGI